MCWPTLRDWMFGCKTFVAAMLALYVAMSLGLERPYWALASAYIASQPLSGATRSKAIYRGCGTIAGAMAAVALVPPLSNAPVLLSLALALWTGVCLYVALLDRTPRSYAFMLAGYTGAIVGFPSVSAPSAIFDTAVTRVEEIGLGITSATLVATVIFPRPVSVALTARLGAWLGNARRWAVDALHGLPDTGEYARRLAADTVEIDTLAGHLGFDATPWQTQRFALLRQRMVLLLPILASIADRIAALRAPGAEMPAEAEALAADLAAWVGHPLRPPGELVPRIDALEAETAQRADWSGVLLSNLLLRMRELVLIRGDCAILRREMAQEDGVPTPLSFAPEGTAAQAWHRDAGMALLSAVAAVAAVLLVCAAWIATAWPDGYVAAEMVAVACSFFAAQDDPVPSIVTFLQASLVGVTADCLLLFGVLPATTTFAGLVLVLAPLYILGGVLVSVPETANFGRGFTANGTTLLALQESYSGDFPSFVNSGTAFVLGLVVAAVITRLIRSVGAEFSSRRLLRVIWRELAEAAERRGNQDRPRYVGLMLDRLALIAPRLAEGDPRSALAAADALADIRIGLNIIDLRRSRHHLGPAERERIDAMLDTLAADYRFRASRGTGASPRARLLGLIDAALRQVAQVPPGPGRADALLGLIGIRRGLFPQAGAPEIGVA